jgi:ubiquitin carboxyl-terminal hydrolase 44/49
MAISGDDDDDGVIVLPAKPVEPPPPTTPSKLMPPPAAPVTSPRKRARGATPAAGTPATPLVVAPPTPTPTLTPTAPASASSTPSRGRGRGKGTAAEPEPVEFQHECPHLPEISLSTVGAKLFAPGCWTCTECGTSASVWGCLTCSHFGCGRYDEEHAYAHFSETGHALALDINSKLCYCYKCDQYIPKDNKRGDLATVRQRLEELETMTLAESRTRRGTVLRASSFLPRPLTQQDHDRDDRLCTAVQHWRLRTLSRAWNKWRAVQLQRTMARLRAPDKGEAPARVRGAAAGETARLLASTAALLARGANGTSTRKPAAALLPGQTGLRNLGNTCYMNATLQALANIPPLRDYFVNVLLPPGEQSHVAFHDQQIWRQNTMDCHKMAERSRQKRPALADASLCLELHQLLRVIWSGKYAVVTPSSLLYTLWKCVPKFRNYQQQDAQEFLCYLRDAIHLELVTGFQLANSPAAPVPVSAARSTKPDGAAAERTIIEDVFEGRLVSEVVCGTCAFASRRAETLLDLSLDVPVQHVATTTRSRQDAAPPHCTLAACLQSFTAAEALTDYMCEKCRAPRAATKQLLLLAAPQYLCVVLKRFAWTVGTAKIDTQVEFPLRGLDLRPYCSRLATPPPLYDLHSVVVHHGSGLKVGHYTAYSFNEKRDGWSHFNDARVTPATAEEVAGCQAYMLFYHARPLLPG